MTSPKKDRIGGWFTAEEQRRAPIRCGDRCRPLHCRAIRPASENCAETSRRGGLPSILTLRLVAFVLKVLEPTDVVAQHAPIALR
jgi:hypothetical protein